MSFSSKDADIKSEIAFVPELLKDLGAGRILIPKFQRPFVWSPQKVLFLLDSISRRYPMGGVLFWDTEEVMNSLDRIGDIPLPNAPPGLKSYVLDGQQRLTTLYCVLQPNIDISTINWIWDVWFDLESEEFIHLRNQQPQARHFPVRACLDAFAFHEAVDAIRSSQVDKEAAKGYTLRAQELAETVRQYRVPVTRITRTDLDQAVQIFSRVNSSSAKILPDQMVSALTYREMPGGKTVFSLSDEIDAFQMSLTEYYFGSLDRVILLRTLLVELELDVYRTNWLTLRNEKIEAMLPGAVARCKSTLLRTIQFLKKEGVGCDRLLPYAMQVVALSAFFRKYRDTDPEKKEKIDLIRRWFWVSSFTGWFAGGNSTTIRQVIQDMTRLAGASVGNFSFESIDLDAAALPLPTSYDFRTARIKTHLLCQFDKARPLDFGDNPIDPALKAHQSGHKALGKIFPSRDDYPHDSPANRLFLGEENSAGIREHLSEKVSQAFLHSHHITSQMFDQIDNPSQFLALRRQYLIELENSFMQARGVTPSQVEDTGGFLVLDSGDYSE
ncbi:MAG: DUF262 domain-containing protein [Acidobacteriota bacterium]|nr:DUF262 domain-containing protein [Acidobacteriota bacterium]